MGRWKTMFPECAKCGGIGTEKTLERHDGEWFCIDHHRCLERRVNKMENKGERDLRKTGEVVPYTICFHTTCENKIPVGTAYCILHRATTTTKPKDICVRPGCGNPRANYCPEHDGRSAKVSEWYGKADGSFTVYPGRSPGCGRCGMQHLNCNG